MTALGVPASGTAVSEGNRWSGWTGLSGVVFGVLIVVSTFITGGAPDPSNPAKVRAWDIKHTTLLNVSVLVTVLAVVAGVYFMTWVHSRLAGRDGGWMGSMFLAGLVIWAVSGAVSAGLHATIGSDAKHLSTDSLQLVASLDANFNYPIGCIGVAAMFLAAGFLIRRSRLLPGWLAWVSWVFALTGASFVLGFVALLGSALWVIVVGSLLAARSRADG